MPGPGDVYPQELWAHSGALQIPQERTCGMRKGHSNQAATKSSPNHKTPHSCYHGLEQSRGSRTIVLTRAVHWASRGCRAGEV